MEDRCHVWPAVTHSLFFAGCRITLITRTLNERDDLHAVLAFLHGTSERLPNVEGEHVLARPNISFGNAFRDKAGNDGWIIAPRHAVASAVKRFGLHFSLRHWC